MVIREHDHLDRNLNAVGLRRFFDNKEKKVRIALITESNGYTKNERNVRTDSK